MRWIVLVALLSGCVATTATVTETEVPKPSDWTAAESLAGVCVTGTNLMGNRTMGVIVSKKLRQKDGDVDYVYIYSPVALETVRLSDVAPPCPEDVLIAYPPERREVLQQWLKGGPNPMGGEK